MKERALTTPNRFVAETRVQVRYAETDAMGIVHHASYIIYFEEGRSNYIRQRGRSYADFEREGYYLAVTEVNARYVQAAVYDQVLRVRCWVEQMRSRGLTFAYEILDDKDQLMVTGYSKHICLDKAGNVAVIPEDWRLWDK
ncbi:MAG: acyl-CoA thioesterase [Chloroflexi bacterium]|nr:MAG: acyl-CoA thioesterase [Chloroflexota bacterium]